MPRLQLQAHQRLSFIYLSSEQVNRASVEDAHFAANQQSVSAFPTANQVTAFSSMANQNQALIVVILFNDMKLGVPCTLPLTLITQQIQQLRDYSN